MCHTPFDSTGLDFLLFLRSQNPFDSSGLDQIRISGILNEPASFRLDWTRLRKEFPAFLMSQTHFDTTDLDLVNLSNIHRDLRKLRHGWAQVDQWVTILTVLKHRHSLLSSKWSVCIQLSIKQAYRFLIYCISRAAVYTTLYSKDIQTRHSCNWKGTTHS